MADHSFEDLDVWKRSCALAVQIYKHLRECREYGLRDQMQRSAVSIASNIAEGSERSPKDFARFLAIAKGSAAELRTQVYIATRIGLLDNQAMQALVRELKEISRMLTALAHSIQPQTPKPKTQNPKPKTQNPKPKTQN